MIRKAHITRRAVLRAGAASSLTLAAPSVLGRAAKAAGEVLYVNTWGGSMEETEVIAYFKPFTAKTGVTIRPVSPMSFAKLKAQVRSGNYEWDVSSSNAVDVFQAMHEGLLQPVDPEAAKQIPKELITGDGVANMSLASCLVYRNDKFPNGGPKSWADFWDVKRFPGPRSLLNRSYTSLAFALLADGVPLDKLYPLDIDRGFRKLDEIKPHIKVWWTQGSQSQQLIHDGEVSMIGMWNARAQELIDRGDKLTIVWEGAENYMGTWFVPKGSPRGKLAWQFIAFCVQPERQAAYCNRLNYGPSNPKAFDYIKPETIEKLPTAPDHLKVSFAPDAQWLAPQMAKLRERWTQWIAS